MSSTDSVRSTKEVSPIEAVDEYEDAEKNYQPKSLKFWTIIAGMYLAIFIVALVSFVCRLKTRDPGLENREIYVEYLANIVTGPNHHCHSHPTHHR